MPELALGGTERRRCSYSNCTATTSWGAQSEQQPDRNSSDLSRLSRDVRTPKACAHLVNGAVEVDDEVARQHSLVMKHLPSGVAAADGRPLASRTLSARCVSPPQAPRGFRAKTWRFGTADLRATRLRRVTARRRSRPCLTSLPASRTCTEDPPEGRPAASLARNSSKTVRRTCICSVRTLKHRRAVPQPS